MKLTKHGVLVWPSGAMINSDQNLVKEEKVYLDYRLQSIIKESQSKNLRRVLEAGIEPETM